jgi:hypothetical protein
MITFKFVKSGSDHDLYEGERSVRFRVLRAHLGGQFIATGQAEAEKESIHLVAIHSDSNQVVGCVLYNPESTRLYQMVSFTLLSTKYLFH